MSKNQPICYFTPHIRENTAGVSKKSSMLLLPYFSGSQNDKNIKDLLFVATVKPPEVTWVKTINTSGTSFLRHYFLMLYKCFLCQLCPFLFLGFTCFFPFLSI